MKKTISMILVLILIMTTTNMAVAINVFAENTSATFSGTCGDNITWTLDDNGVLNICGNGEMYSLREYITSISFRPQAWFKDDLEDKIKEVIIEDGITSIGDYAFNDFDNLTNIQIPDSVIKIGDYSFEGCGLKSIKLPSNLEIIGERAFWNVRLNEIYIPDSVTNIGVGAFVSGSASSRILPNICVDENNKYYCSLNGSLYSKDKKTLIIYSNHDKSNTYSLPESIEKIEDYAFYWSGNLTTISFNNKLVSIGEHAFETCNNLKNFELPDTVMYIGKSAFENCNFETIKLPSSLKSIEERCFADCDKLKSVHIGKNVSSIKASAFVGCILLDLFTVENGNSRYYVEDSVLFDSLQKELIKYPQGKKDSSYTIPEGIVSIGDESFAYGLSEGGGTIYKTTPLTNITIPNSVTKIGSYAFAGQKCLEEFIIPKSVTSIGDRAFYECTLKELVIPGSVTYIGGDIAHGSGVEKIELMEGINTINEEAFANSLNQLNKLSEIYLPISLTTIEDDAFWGAKSPLTIHYAGSKSQWEKIKIGAYNNPFSRLTIMYNSPVKGKIILSENDVEGAPNTKIVLNLYKDIYKTPYDGGFKISVSDESVVTTTHDGKSVILNMKVPGTSVVTISSTDGNGAEVTCNVNVIDVEKNDLLERLALCQIVYSDSLVQGKTIGEQTANKNSNMFYLGYGNNIKWAEFYKQYIDDYTVVMLPQNPQDGFYAAAFESPEGDVVIAHRGSEGSGFLGVVKFWNEKDVDWWGTNLGMFTGLNLSSQFTQAIDFYDEVKDAFSGKDITLTGHSLGGALASYVAINKGVRCDNINGATGWLFNNEILANPENYLVDFIGLDKYVFENFNGHDDPINNSVTTMANKGVFNYVKYNDSSRYNKQKKNELINGETVEIPEKDYHKISSILDYDETGVSLTSIKKEYFLKSGFTNIGKFDYIGTSGSEQLTKSATKSVALHGTGITGKYLVPASCYVLAGDGNDVVSFTSGGDDVLVGNAGDDVLSGGPGNDIYVYGKEFGCDTIIDPSGDDKIVFTELAHSDLTIQGALITYGANQIEISDKSKRKEKITVVDKNNDVKYISFQNASTYSLRRTVATDSTKNVQVYGNATVEIYNSAEELIDTLVMNDFLEESVGYMDYGMITYSPNVLGLILLSDGYIIKVKSNEAVSVWTVSDADNPTFAKQTYIDNKDLSDGSVIVINTGEMVNEQLSVKIVNDTAEESIYSEAPEYFSITADKTEIKTGESIILSVTEGFEEAVTWKCTNGNAILSQNEDNTISVLGVNPGEETLRAYLQNDELYSDEVTFIITEDSMPNVVVTCNDEIYDGTVAASNSVLFNVSMVDGYDTIVFDTFSPYSQIEDTNSFVVDSVGEHVINVYCENSETGATTDTFTFEFEQDSESPTISGAENGGVYYTDRVIEVSDTAIDTIYVNDELCEQEEFVISDAGKYTITATDSAGNSTSISFEIKKMPEVTEINVENFAVVSEIRSEFEKNKYQLSENRRLDLEGKISALEDAKNSIVVVTVYEDEIIKKMSKESFNNYQPSDKEGYVFIGWYTDQEYLPETKISSISDDITDNISVFAWYLPADELIKVSRINAMYVDEYFVYDIHYEYVTQDFTLKVDLVNENNEIVETKNIDVCENETDTYDDFHFKGDVENYKIVFNFLNIDNQLISKEMIVPTSTYSNGFLYTTVNNEATIVGYDAYDEKIIVPEFLDDHKVVSIGEQAFCNKEEVKSILIPDTIKIISQNAFEGCLNLEKVHYKGTEEEWNELGVDNETIHNSVVTFNAIHNNGIIYKLTESGAKVIDSLNNSSLSIPFSIDDHPVVSIEEDAFKDTYLECVKVPNSIRHIDSSAFSGCEYLSSITYIGTEDEWCEYGISVENVNNASVEFVEPDFVEPYIIDYSYDQINANYNVGLTYSLVDSTMIFSIYDEEGKLERTGTQFVPKGTSSVNAVLPLEADDRSHEIKIFFWNNLNSLKPLCEPINDYIYARPERISSGDYSYTVYKGEATLVDYTGTDDDIQFPSNIDGYPVTCIKYMSSLYGRDITSITIPNTIMDIDIWFLSDIQTLVEISVSEDNAYYSSHDGVLYNKDKSVLVKYPSNKDALSFSIPDSVSIIELYAFCNNKNLKTIIIPESVTQIREGCFFGCDNFENIYYCSSKEAWNKIDLSDYSGIDENLISYNCLNNIDAK